MHTHAYTLGGVEVGLPTEPGIEPGFGAFGVAQNAPVHFRIFSGGSRVASHKIDGIILVFLFRDEG